MNKSRLKRPVLLIKTGATIPETREEFGDFEEWFARGLGVQGVAQIDVFAGELPPDPAGFSGVIVTGSASMVSHQHDWSERTADWLHDAVHLGMPVLGVCFGHQLLAYALGGAVGPNPRGRQIGTQQINTLPSAASDPLMCELPSSFHAQTTHVESVHELPPGAVRLASSPRDENHAFRYGERAWGVQFHPEFGADIMSGYIRARSHVIQAEGLDPEHLASRVSETPVAQGLLARFTTFVAGLPGNSDDLEQRSAFEDARLAANGPAGIITRSPLVHGARTT
ncbi:MAG TPA: glutamine amidotransferase [Xanthomonadales bacterium]|nr:glutamine amidotransferase [Xanthomonadales bacterium]